VKLSIFHNFVKNVKSYSLRRRSIIRLLIVGIFFVLYAGSMCYLNYYIHNISAQIVTIYFTLYQKAMMVHTLGLVPRRAILTENKEILQNNPDPDSNVVYLMDAVNVIYESTKEEQEFRKTASGSVFGEYLDLVERANTPDFCIVSDSYNNSQTTPCEKYYTGPKNQGLTMGLSYYVDFYINFANQILLSNLSDPDVKNKFLNEPKLTEMSIFYQGFNY